MTITVIRKRLVEYIQSADAKKLKAVYVLLKEEIEQKDTISLEQYNKELNTAEIEFDNGNFISHAAMKKMVKQW